MSLAAIASAQSCGAANAQTRAARLSARNGSPPMIIATTQDPMRARHGAHLIHHVFEIAAPCEVVYAALTTPDALSSWWTTHVQADTTTVGAVITFVFHAQFSPRLRVAELDPNARVMWEGVGGHDAWGETAIRFDLDATRSGTEYDSGITWAPTAPKMPSVARTSGGATISTACVSSARPAWATHSRPTTPECTRAARRLSPTPSQRVAAAARTRRVASSPRDSRRP